MDASTKNLIQPFWSWLLFGSKVFGGLFLTVTVLLYFNQDKLLYFPNPPNIPHKPDDNPYGFSSPSNWTKKGRVVNSKNPNANDLPIPFEDKMVPTPDGNLLHTWLLLQDDAEKCPTLIYFHGNAANMGFRLQNAAEMFATAKINILMMDYRGYGKSTGTPNEVGLKIDGETILQYVRSHPRLTNSPVIVFGRSLGGAVCFHLAEKYPKEVAAVIVENTFLSISAMVDVVLPFLKYIKPFVLNIKWDSERLVTNVLQPILFISGDADELVPPFHMKKLRDLAIRSKHCEFYTVMNGHHNDTWEKGGNKYYEAFKAFVDDFVRDREALATATNNNNSNDNNKSSSASSSSPPPVVVSSDQEDEDYLLVKQSIGSIPTMQKDFGLR